MTVQGPDRRNLFGSPLDPEVEAQAAEMARAVFTPLQANAGGPPANGTSRRASVDVIVPVFKGRAETLACLEAALASTGRGTRVIVVDDASPDPALVNGLAALAQRQRRITLVRLPKNRGFPAAVNAGIAMAAGRDVVLLNSDTLVPPGWLDRLRAAAYSALDIGTVSPLSNDATILSYPDRNGANPVPDLAGTVALDALAQKANGAAIVNIPVGVGFCLYVRRACLDAVGGLREDLFAQGYGEENDLCLRARQAGWRNVATPGVFVAHVGAASFGGAREHLIHRNTAILNRLHPGHDALIAEHVAKDTLFPARQRMDALRWAAGRRAGAVVFITHAGRGGVERVVQDRAATTAAAGQRAILLRPVAGGAVRIEEPGQEFPNLVFPVPEKLDALVRLLRADQPVCVELHHTLGHAHEIAGLAERLGTEAVSFVHDYARFCPQIALIGTARRYCGEPEMTGCEACVAALGSRLEDNPSIRTLLGRSAAELRGAAKVIAPSADAALRIARHFPGVSPALQPWEQDRAWSGPAPQPGPTLRVVVVGAIGVEKGFEVLLDCVCDAQARGLPMNFVVVGFTVDDEQLMAAGPAFVTGPYAEADAVALIRDQKGHLAFIPSVWPETWCFALSRAWEGGLPAVVFDLGAQAERVRATGGGTVLPLGLGATATNDVLLRLARPQPASHCRPG